MDADESSDENFDETLTPNYRPEVMNLFVYHLLKDDGHISPDEKINLRTQISFASQEEMVDYEEKLKSRGMHATFTRVCDKCQKNLSHTPKNTDFTCQRCGFINDLCEGCQWSLIYGVKHNPRTLKECMKGVGCNDTLKGVYNLVQSRKESQEAPF